MATELEVVTLTICCSYIDCKCYELAIVTYKCDLYYEIDCSEHGQESLRSIFIGVTVNGTAESAKNKK